MGDRNGAMALAFGVSAALLKRERTGTGSVVDVSLLATAMWTLSSDVLAALGGDAPAAAERARAAREPARRHRTGPRTAGTSSSCSSSPTATGPTSAG